MTHYAENTVVMSIPNDYNECPMCGNILKPPTGTEDYPPEIRCKCPVCRCAITWGRSIIDPRRLIIVGAYREAKRPWA